MSSSRLQGVRVLVAEDQMIVAMELEDMLHEAGCEVIGPVGTLQSAIDLAHGTTPDVAILDVNLHGTYIFPLADELCARGIPVILSTGYGASRLPKEWQDAPRLSKPFARAELEAMLVRLVRNNARNSRA